MGQNCRTMPNMLQAFDMFSPNVTSCTKLSALLKAYPFPASMQNAASCGQPPTPYCLHPRRRIHSLVDPPKRRPDTTLSQTLTDNHGHLFHASHHPGVEPMARSRYLSVHTLRLPRPCWLYRMPMAHVPQRSPLSRRYTDTKLRQLNYCRLYLHVTTISEILNAPGAKS